MRICVACHDLAVAGGIFRFERFGQVAERWGHEVVFVRFSEQRIPPRASRIPAMTMTEARSMHWDVVMVPGAGFPEATIARFRELVDPRFGVRVQHVLNDEARLPAFLAVNRAFRPDVVVVNNRHWSRDRLADLTAPEVHVLEGAVDGEHFRPRPWGERTGPYRVGGLANKNPGPLVEVVRMLPDCMLDLFGPPGDLAERAGDLVQQGRIVLRGVLTEDALPGYYRGLDCVVHTETMAGWANLAAEAMASGVPLICTHAGTLAFAEHEVTALVVEPEPSAIGSAIGRLRREPGLSERLARQGRERISAFTWEAWTASLLELVKADGRATRVGTP
jgi:glycosyltransferase involved in cell wall biosynthesis